MNKIKGDVMREMGLEISMGCDRTKTDTFSNQGGFVEFCVKPLTVSLHELISELDWCLKNININAEKWAKLKQQQQQQQQQQENEEIEEVQDKENQDNNLLLAEDKTENESSSTTETDLTVGTSSFNSNQGADLI